MAPRTQQEFDQWYEKSGGDPWDTAGLGVQRRLQRSLNFILSRIASQESVHFVELGPFNGDFTRMLGETYRNGRVTGFEISQVALDEAKRRTAHLKNVELVREDMLGVKASRLNARSSKEPIAVTALECVYYLPEEERRVCISNLVREFPGAPIFLSAPIKGGTYFTEQGLIDLFDGVGYRLAAFEVLNLRKYERRFLMDLLRVLANHSKALRRSLANQVLYCFEPKKP